MTIHFLNTKPTTTEVVNFDAILLDYISVTQPYFALRNLHSNGEYIYANFTTELPETNEEGPINCAEVGRHLAILGSVVLAKENPIIERHHYLATDAIINRISFKTGTTTLPTDLSCRAKVTMMNRKKGLVFGEVFASDGKLLYQIEVTYMILKKSIFERMFAEYRMETNIDPTYNPYKEDTHFTELNLNVKSCYASIGKVQLKDCPGHFKNYPALPVARIGNAMGKIAGLHFMHLNPNEKKKYFVSNVELHARQLIFTGEELKFRTEIIDPNPGKGMIIKTIAYNDQHDYIVESVCNYHY